MSPPSRLAASARQALAVDALERPARKPIRTRLAVTIAGFGALAVAAIALAPLVGSTHISLSRAFDRSHHAHLGATRIVDLTRRS